MQQTLLTLGFADSQKNYCGYVCALRRRYLAGTVAQAHGAIPNSPRLSACFSSYKYRAILTIRPLYFS